MDTPKDGVRSEVFPFEFGVGYRRTLGRRSYISLYLYRVFATAPFEERQLWAKARTLGIEAGVSGALSVIPQILISMVTKMPAFVLCMIREGTLSCVRSVRALASNDLNKLQSISIIMASTASAVVGLYVSRVISSGLAGVPLLNHFNSQITSILSGLLVTAVPLVAIYALDQNKKRLVFAINKDKLTPLLEPAES